MTTIDIHTHFVPQSWSNPSKEFGTGPWPWVRPVDAERAMIMLGDAEFRPIDSLCWNAEQRIAAMQRDAIDVQLLSATPVFFAYDKPVDQAVEIAVRMNDAALQLAHRGQGRMFALCQVPMQDLRAACDEVTRCRRAGHVGVQIGNHVGERNLDDPATIEFLQHCASERFPVMVHPWDMMAADRTAQYMMGWTVGMPAETQLGIVSMILGGAFDRLPESLRICFAHGGGSFSFLLGRLENAWHRRDVARGRSKLPPSAYLQRFSLDSAVFDPAALRFLANQMGPERVMLGSDFPYPLGEERVGKLIRETPGFGTALRDRLLGGNAAEFFGLQTANAQVA